MPVGGSSANLGKNQKTDEKVDNDRSIWSNCDEDTINSVYGDKFHPFAENGEFSDSKFKS